MTLVQTAILSGALVFISMIEMSAAATRHHPHRTAQAIHAPSAGGGPLRILTAEFMRDCEQLAADLRNFPADEIEQTVDPDDTQAKALKKVRSVASDAANDVAQACPPAVPDHPADRLDMIDREIGGLGGAIKALQPALLALYGSLSDEQKAQLVLRFAQANRQGGSLETTGSAQGGSENPGKRRLKKPEGKQNDAPWPRASQPWWSCGQWQEKLGDWPARGVEQTLAIGRRQRAAFYELAAAMQRAADTLADSCPQKTPVTPSARIDDMKQKLDALRKSIAAIRPALGEFYRVLDDGQRKQLDDAI